MANRHKPRGLGPCLLVTPIDQTQTENRRMTIVHSPIATRLGMGFADEPQGPLEIGVAEPWPNAST